MKRFLRSTAAVFLALVLLLTAIPVSAAPANDTADTPFVFVHGMMGWGDYDEETATNPYWGGYAGVNIIEELTARGYTCVSASVGGISSAWDRACELYAQLTGGTVDYGAAHAAAHNHDRYGCTYDTPLLDSFGETAADGTVTKINLLGHSFGGPTIRVFASLMANGDEAEQATSGDDVSPLFTGGKADWIQSVTTLSSPNNGTPISDLLCVKLPFMLVLISLYANIRGMKNDYIDLRLHQFGLSGANVKLDLGKVFNFARSGDNCGIDMTIAGAKAINERFPAVDSIYYFCYACNSTKASDFGNNQLPTESTTTMFSFVSWFIGRCGGKTYGGETLSDDWEKNDGLVPVISAMEPIGADAADFATADTLTPGIWYRMPIIENANHSHFMGVGMEDPLAFYAPLIEMLTTL